MSWLCPASWRFFDRRVPLPSSSAVESVEVPCVAGYVVVLGVGGGVVVAVAVALGMRCYRGLGWFGYVLLDLVSEATEGVG